MSIPRDRWPTIVGLLGATALVLVFGPGQRAIEIDWWNGSILGVSMAVWSLAVSFLTIFLIVQIVLNSRTTLARERRLVDVAADLRETSAELDRLAKIDPLTGVLNRRAFFERLGSEFRRSRRYGRPLTVLMIDIDHFKSVNDRFGHSTGDDVLVACARQAASSLRESDEIGRYGGEEFAVFLPETTRADGALVAEKLRAAVEQLQFDATDRRGRGLRLTISVGVATIPELGVDDEQALTNQADLALYAAKRAGRNQISTDTGVGPPLGRVAG